MVRFFDLASLYLHTPIYLIKASEKIMPLPNLLYHYHNSHIFTLLQGIDESYSGEALLLEYKVQRKYCAMTIAIFNKNSLGQVSVLKKHFRTFSVECFI